jgi:SagB-type dehydrogenase family enzyme
MNRIDLLNPQPRKSPANFARFSYKVISKNYLPFPVQLGSKDFFSVLESRRTRRSFAPLSDMQLSNLLWYCGKVRETGSLSNGLPIQHRCPPSAGGIHPIDILLFETKAPRPVLYDGVAHALCELGGTRVGLVKRLLTRVNRLVPVQDSKVVWFVAEFDRTLSRYKRGESLVWRDAGTLLGMVCLTAEALGLNCCPLGITGEPYISRILNSRRLVVGVGGCLVGKGSIEFAPTRGS